MHLKEDLGAFTGIVWVFMVLIMTLFPVIGYQMKETTKGTQLIVLGLVIFVMLGVVGSLQYRIQQSELRLRESVLKLEPQMAQLTERLSPKV